MILDLLRLSASAVFNRRHSGYVGANRWNGDAAFDYILNPDEREKQIGFTIKYTDVPPEESLTGISVICVDLGASGSQL